MLALALRIAAVAKSKKAQDVIVLDMHDVSTFCDYFVLLSGTSLRQINAIAKAIQEDLSRPSLKSYTTSKKGRDLDKSRTLSKMRDKDGIKSLSKVSGNDESGWIVLDYVSVVVHIFYKPMREFYSLERLWSDAKKVRIPRSVSR